MFTKNHLMLILFFLLGSALFGQRINFTECGYTYTYSCTGGTGTNISADYTNTWNLSGLGDYTVNIPTDAGWFYTVLGDGYGVTGNFTNFGQTGTFHFTIMILPPFGGGDGSENNPYIISTPAHLDSIRNHLDSYFLQTADLNMNVAPYNAGKGWIPIGTETKEFKGHYNVNNNYSISSLMINDSTLNHASLFGVIRDSEISNVRFSAVNINGKDSCGALAGFSFTSYISKCSSAGIIIGGNETGGLIGSSSQDSIAACFSLMNVSGEENVGGLVGYNNSIVLNCYSRGTVTGTNGVGGLTGVNDNYSVTNCFSAGNVTGNSDTGGLIGINSASVVNSYWDTETSGQSSSSGGIGKTTAEMMTQSTFSGWDFTTPVWKIVDSEIYPFLAWEPSSAISFSVSPAGSGAISGIGGVYPVGTLLDLVATSNINSNFLNWTDNHKTILSTDSAFTYTVTSLNTGLTANFYVIVPKVFIIETAVLDTVSVNFNSIDVGSYASPAVTDIDGDGLLDLLIGDYDGFVKRYEQNSVNSTVFTLVSANFNWIDVGTYASPVVTDIDGDGLLDLLIGDYDGYIERYEQIAAYSATFNSVTFTFNSIDVGNNASPAITDLDGDGLLDLIVGDQSGFLERYEQNSVNSTAFTLITTTFNSIDVGINASPVFSDVDCDGLLDLMVGDSDGYIEHYRQNDTNSTVFTLINATWKSIDVSNNACPEFTDLDGDGLYDMLAGDSDGYIEFYEQYVIQSLTYPVTSVGSTSQKNYVVKAINLYNDLIIECPDGFKASLKQNTEFAQSLSVTPVNGIIFDTLYVNFQPDSVKLYTGNIAHSSQDAVTKFLPISGTVPIPVITLTKPTITFSGLLDFSIDVGYFSQPECTDLDGDGLLDLMVGDYDGKIEHYEQNAVNSTSFTFRTSTFNSFDVGSYAAPAFTDIDNDGLLDMLAGDSDGYIERYEQNAVNSTLFTLVTANFNSIDVGTYAAPAITDLDGDGLLDLMVGDYDGKIEHYEQNTVSSAVFTLRTATFNSIDVGLYASPAFTDLDGDGLSDMMVGDYDGKIEYYEQNAVNSTSFTLISATFNSIDAGDNSTPTFTDIDGDGLLNMLVGGYNGNIKHYEQTNASLASLDFGSIEVGTSLQKFYVINTVNLVEDLFINCPAGYTASLSKDSGFEQNLSIPHVNGIISTKLFIDFEPTTTGTFSGNIDHSSLSATTKFVAVSGTGYFNAPPNVSITSDSVSVIISWDAVPGATSYKVYSSNDPYGTFLEDTGGTLVGETWTLPYTESRKFYYVVAVDGTKTAGKAINVKNETISR